MFDPAAVRRLPGIRLELRCGNPVARYSWLLHAARFRLDQLSIKLSRQIGDNLILRLKQVAAFAIEAFGPKMHPALSVEESGVDPRAKGRLLGRSPRLRLLAARCRVTDVTQYPIPEILL